MICSTDNASSASLGILTSGLISRTGSPGTAAIDLSEGGKTQELGLRVFSGMVIGGIEVMVCLELGLRVFSGKVIGGIEVMVCLVVVE